MGTTILRPVVTMNEQFKEFRIKWAQVKKTLKWVEGFYAFPLAC